MRFIRFVLAHRHQDSGVEEGVFRIAYALRDSVDLEPADRDVLAEILTWVEKNLETPTRFNRTTSKGFYRRKTPGHSVVMLSEPRVGYVIHDDAFQVVAEPFSDTRTG
jgi:hypothetical protein